MLVLNSVTAPRSGFVAASVDEVFALALARHLDDVGDLSWYLRVSRDFSPAHLVDVLSRIVMTKQATGRMVADLLKAELNHSSFHP